MNTLAKAMVSLHFKITKLSNENIELQIYFNVSLHFKITKLSNRRIPTLAIKAVSLHFKITKLSNSYGRL